MEKTNVILDTDMGNEVDDHFALAYLLKSQDLCNIQAITIAPFSNSHFKQTLSIEQASILSMEQTKKILALMDETDLQENCFDGAHQYFKDSKEMNTASEKMIQLAHANDKTKIVCIGAITNLAIALYHDPSIISKIQVVWLGGHSFLSDHNQEFNFRQDVEAVRFVFNSGVKLVVIPCQNVASELSVSLFEMEHYLRDVKPEIRNHFCNLIQMCQQHPKRSFTDRIGYTKVIWDLAAIAYIVNPNWVLVKQVSCPDICENTAYRQTAGKHEMTFVQYLNRNAIFQDFFIRMGCAEPKEDSVCR